MKNTAVRALFMSVLIISFLVCNFGNKEEVVKVNKVIYNLDNAEDELKFKAWLKINLVDNPTDSISLQYKSSKVLKNKRGNVSGCLFEDAYFEVYSNCSGEFGGFVVFKDKQTSKFYYLECTCLKMIDCQKGSYFITETLSHMSGFARITKIDNPRKLVEINIDSLYLGWQKNRFPNLDSYEIFKLLENQGETVLDTQGITINTFYKQDNRDFMVCSDYRKTYFGEIKNKRFIIADTLLNQGIWSSYDAPNRIIGGIYYNSFHHSQSDVKGLYDQMDGKILIKKDTIVIGYKGFKRK